VFLFSCWLNEANNEKRQSEAETKNAFLQRSMSPYSKISLNSFPKCEDRPYQNSTSPASSPLAMESLTNGTQEGGEALLERVPDLDCCLFDFFLREPLPFAASRIP